MTAQLLLAISEGAYVGGHGGSAAQQGVIYGIAAVVLGPMVLIVKQQVEMHFLMNSRLDQLLASRAAESHAAGVVQGTTTERAHPMTSQQEVVLVPDPDNPLPVKPVQ